MPIFASGNSCNTASAMTWAAEWRIRCSRACSALTAPVSWVPWSNILPFQ